MNEQDKLDSILNSECPKVYVGSWSHLSKKGWRWAGNFFTSIAAMPLIIELQNAHGTDNVTVGHPWAPKQLKPMEPKAGVDRWFGVYVRDVDKQVDQFRERLEEL